MTVDVLEDGRLGRHVEGLVPVASISRRDAVISQIRRSVVMGALRPGDKLTEASLARTLNVSRPTVREALSQFAGEGLLIQEPYKGIRIAHHSPTMLMDIARVRMALDMLACEAILEDASGDRLTATLDASRAFEALEFDPDPFVRHEAHITFHRAMWVASKNEVLVRLWPVIEAQITITLAQEQELRADQERVHGMHKQLIDALLTRDLSKVAAAFYQHHVVSTQEFIELLAQSEHG